MAENAARALGSAVNQEKKRCTASHFHGKNILTWTAVCSTLLRSFYYLFSVWNRECFPSHLELNNNNNNGLAITAEVNRRGARRMWLHDKLKQTNKLKNTNGHFSLWYDSFIRRVHFSVHGDGQYKLLLHLWVSTDPLLVQRMTQHIDLLPFEKSAGDVTFTFLKSWESFNVVGIDVLRALGKKTQGAAPFIRMVASSCRHSLFSPLADNTSIFYQCCQNSAMCLL